MQGAVTEHIRMIEQLGAEAITVKKLEQLDELDGLIIPGGESTTISKLMHAYGFMEAIRVFSDQEKPIFGTCAGLILLAKHIEPDGGTHLDLMNIRVQRNGFGRQRESFEANLDVKGMDEPFQAVFIRAPYIIEVGPHVEVLTTYKDKIVAARQGHLLCSAFHPELTDDMRFHHYFIDMVKESKMER